MGRVLVVEDDHAICAFITDVLEEAGVETVCVQTDRAAYAVLATSPTFRALVLDINLGSGTTGYDVGRFARQAIPDLPVIYMSGETSESSFEAFGVSDSEFLAKPFTRAELLSALRKHEARTLTQTEGP